MCKLRSHSVKQPNTLQVHHKKKTNIGKTVNYAHCFSAQKMVVVALESKTELEGHITFGQHGSMNEKSSLDAVRNIFVNKMKSLSQVHCSTLSTVQTVQTTVINNEYATSSKI